jgi:hypothetical protein
MEGDALEGDAYIGCVEREDGTTVEYALFGVDPERDDGAIKGSIESLPDDLGAEGCKCQYVRVAVTRTDEASRAVAREQWHSDEACPAQARHDQG